MEVVRNSKNMRFEQILEAWQVVQDTIFENLYFSDTYYIKTIVY